MAVATGKRFHRICPNCQLKVCTQCEQAKPPADFYRRSCATDDLMPECKACNSRWTKDYALRCKSCFQPCIPDVPTDALFQAITQSDKTKVARVKVIARDATGNSGEAISNGFVVK